ncbi:MAG: amino acid racemase [Magnetococcales bacterium]|nr:amino acid racemase [Magnetococcales bacterium]
MMMKKTIGILGGISWESTFSYLKIINRLVRSSTGGVHSPKILLSTIDFGEILPLYHNDTLEKCVPQLIRHARKIERGGADILLIASNTMHKFYYEISQSITIPVLHIVDCLANDIRPNNASKVALLGTQITMEHSFYKNMFANKYGVDLIVPDVSDRIVVNQIILEELCAGIISHSSKMVIQEIIGTLSQEAEGVILGCTELQLLVTNDDVDVHLFDSTAIHAKAAVDWAICD